MGPLRSKFLLKIYLGAAFLVLVATGTMGLFLLTQQEEWGLKGTENIVPALVTASFIGMVSAMLLCWLISRTLSESLSQITEVAASLSRGDFNARVKRMQSDEFGLLGLTLNLLGEEVTQRMATMSQERAQLQAMLAGIVEGIIAIDDDDRILFCNRAVDRMLQAEISSALGKQLRDVTGLGPVLPLVLDARKDRDRTQRELHLGESDKFTILDTKAAYFRGGQASGVVVVMHDVTEIRKLERTRRDFVANVSHELKTPLTSIKGYVETLLSGAKEDPEILERFLHKIDSNVARLVALVQDILSLARIETHDGKLDTEPVEWSSVIRSVITHHEHALTSKHLDLQLDATPDPVVVFGDREAMTQVIDNLLSNAIKYTPEGGRIRLTLRRTQRQALLDVEDSGIGIPPKHLPRIFERFYRVDKPRSREMGGTGLGLSIVRHLVQGMHGKVFVQSQPGVGSKFSVTLRLAD